MTCVPAERENVGLDEESPSVGRTLRCRARRACRRIAGIAAVVVLGLIVFAAWSLYRFGSVSLALAFLKGYAVVPEAALVSAGEVAAREEARVAFRLKNLTAGPLRVVGAKADCACMAFDDLPLAIEPGEWGKMTVRFVPREAEVGQVVEHSVLLYLDATSVPVVLRAQAEVVPPEPRAVGGT